METRRPTFLSQLFHFFGLAAHVPSPTGPRPVVSHHFRIPGENGVLVQLFYPQQAPPSTSGGGLLYRRGVVKGVSEFVNIPHYLLRLFLEAAPHPLLSSPPAMTAGEEEKFPLLLFSHGLGGNAEIYSKQCMDLASHGYVVMALEHEDGSGSHAEREDGTVVPYSRPPPGLSYTRKEVGEFRASFLAHRIREVKTALAFCQNPKNEAVHQRIDWNKGVCLAGHSFGAATSVVTARALPANTFRGILLLDLWPFPIPALKQGLGQENLPVCSLLSQVFASNAESRLTAKLLHYCTGPVVSLSLPGSVHSSFSDTPHWLPEWIGRRFNIVGSAPKDEVHESILTAELGFLEAIFSGKPETLPALQASLVADGHRFTEFTKRDDRPEEDE